MKRNEIKIKGCGHKNPQQAFLYLLEDVLRLHEWDCLGFVQTDYVDLISSVSLLLGCSNPRQAGTAVLHRVVLSHVLHGIMENLAGDL